MSSDAFRLLGLDRKTATETDVRRAYADLLKVTRPEDDRAGFMALRRAFEEARDALRWGYYDEDEDTEPPPDDEPDDPFADDPPVLHREADDPLTDDDAQPFPAEADPPSWPAQAPYVDPVDAAYRSVVDVLTGPWGAGSMTALKAIIDDESVGGIDEYQQLGDALRQLLCDRTGMFLDEAPELILPGWLTPTVFATLDGHFGWTRAQPASRWLRTQHDRMVKIRDALNPGPAPPPDLSGAEPFAALATSGMTKRDAGSIFWVILGALILIVQVVRFIGNISE